MAGLGVEQHKCRGICYDGMAEIPRSRPDWSAYKNPPLHFCRIQVDIASDLGDYVGNTIRGQAAMGDPLDVIGENYRARMDAGREAGPPIPRRSTFPNP